jgi:hypothetical protein
MKNFENYFKKEKWIKVLLLFGVVFLVPFSSGAGSIRDELHQLFLRNKVKAVFEADDHRYDRREEDGILYLIFGG